MSMLGMDIGAVRNLAGQLMAKADDITMIANALTTQLDSAQWVGADATAFRGDWVSGHRAQLMAVAEALRDASSRATANANHQEQVSMTT
jgi:uncharacterized protein YukE